MRQVIGALAAICCVLAGLQAGDSAVRGAGKST
jgi:hypothetical protein